MFCENLFRGIDSKHGSGTSFEVKFSMLEIYNEVARDLLDPKGGAKKGGLKIREHPKKGFYGKLSSPAIFIIVNQRLMFPCNSSARNSSLQNTPLHNQP
jgi:hypothetical protein